MANGQEGEPWKSEDRYVDVLIQARPQNPSLRSQPGVLANEVNPPHAFSLKTFLFNENVQMFLVGPPAIECFVKVVLCFKVELLFETNWLWEGVELCHLKELFLMVKCSSRLWLKLLFVRLGCVGWSSIGWKTGFVKRGSVDKYLEKLLGVRGYKG